MAVDMHEVRNYFIQLQESICARLEAFEPTMRFLREDIETPGGGLSRPRVIAGGEVIEKAAVQFTHSIGAALPPSATERNPHLAGRPFQAAAISLIVHPLNPYVPTTHMNLRYFVVDGVDGTWYFGGGFDLTPFYANRQDIVHWHRTAAAAAGEHYPAMKAACDDYFYLPHRQEPRGVGGVFFDDWTTGGDAASFALVQRIGDAFLPAYVPIVERRKDQPYRERERNWQCYRRGRYAEFNLAIDRGTRYGLQSGRRIESVLASLPPVVTWEYQRAIPHGSPEAALMDALTPRDWL
ncbi:MAG: oxygen-dependent coproporphyrinogen oxidase, partial [Pseudomonadales bacterium]